MRAIVTADLHIHPFRECSQDGGADRLRDGLSAARQTLRVAKDRGCAWVFLGDLKHTRDRWLVSVLNGLLALLGDEFFDVPKLMLAGNHDGLAAGASGLAPFRELGNMTIVEVPSVARTAACPYHVAYWPWQPTVDALPEFLVQARKAEARVLLAHVFLQGSALGPDDVRLHIGAPLEVFGLAGRDRVFDWGFAGDVHKGQQRVGNVWIPGSPLALNWGEQELDKGCLFVDTDAGKVERIPIAAPRFIVEDWTAIAAGEINPTLETHARHLHGKAGAWRDHFVRLMLPAGADPKLVERLREASGARIFQTIAWTAAKKEQRTAVHAGMAPDQLIAEYVRARPPADGISPTKVIESGRRLLGEG